MALRIFMITFGLKYREEPHPHWPSAHPDGWLEVLAADEDEARALARRYIGDAWAFIYPAEKFSPRYMSRGRLATLTPDGPLFPAVGVGLPTPLPETRQVQVSWYETTHYTYTIEVPEDFSLEQDDADEVLEQRICELDTADLDGAFTGTTDRQITEKRWAS